jgi:hypothetical protein
MPFKPHPIQVQALRIAKRFQRGLRPTRVAGKPVGEHFRGIKFCSVPAFVLSAEIGHVPDRDDLIDELCQRGYLVKHDGYPKCPYVPMEYETEDGARVFVHDEDWCQIDVLPHNAKFFRRHVGGFSGQISLRVPSPAGANVKPSKSTVKAPKARRRRDPAGQGDCYEIMPDGFKLLDELDDPVTLTVARANQVFMVSPNTLRRWVRNRKLTNHRAPGVPKNAPIRLAISEVEQHFARR